MSGIRKNALRGLRKQLRGLAGVSEHEVLKRDRLRKLAIAAEAKKKGRRAT